MGNINIPDEALDAFRRWVVARHGRLHGVLRSEVEQAIRDRMATTDKKANGKPKP